MIKITDIDRKYGTYCPYRNLSSKGEMRQVLKEKPAFIDDSFGTEITTKEMKEFANENDLYFGETVLKEGTGAPQTYNGRPNIIQIVAKNQRAFNQVANAMTEKELGLALGYIDLKVFPLAL